MGALSVGAASGAHGKMAGEESPDFALLRLRDTLSSIDPREALKILERVNEESSFSSTLEWKPQERTDFCSFLEELGKWVEGLCRAAGYEDYDKRTWLSCMKDVRRNLNYPTSYTLIDEPLGELVNLMVSTVKRAQRMGDYKAREAARKQGPAGS